MRFTKRLLGLADLTNKCRFRLLNEDGLHLMPLRLQQAVKCSHISHNFERLPYFPTFLQKPPIFPIFTFYLTDISWPMKLFDLLYYLPLRSVQI
jgi:hypothetical protein